jgi:hypothetical protein
MDILKQGTNLIRHVEKVQEKQTSQNYLNNLKSRG